MIQKLLSFLTFCGFVLLLPVFFAAAYAFGSRDEQLLMRWAVIIFGTPCLMLWYVLLSELVFKRRSSYFVQFIIFIGGYVLVGFMIHTRVLSLVR